MSTVPVEKQIETRATARPVTAALESAASFHRSGDAAAAEALYREILAADPRHSEANHNLGVLLIQLRRACEALPHLKAALDGEPERPLYWRSCVEGLMQAGGPTEALRFMREAGDRGVPKEFAAAMIGRLEVLVKRIGERPGAWMPDLHGEVYTRVLKRLHETLRPQTYLEIGVETGATLALARCASIGIDPRFQFSNMDVVRQIVAKPSLMLYQMASDAFFDRWHPAELLGSPIDFAFLDGMHHCEYLLRDFLNTERYCLPGSVIALHDCLPLELPMAERARNLEALDPQRQTMWAGDVWRTALLLKRRRPELRMTVLDAAPTGLVLVSNLDPQYQPIVSCEDWVEEMLSWSLEEITLAGYYREMGVEPEIHLRSPEQLLARVRADGSSDRSSHVG
ncbi:tetratricopeptide repeat protein [Silvibacterium dinghuense]|uniref:Uncharacterized protein n=1 Tax=Silvibacterium dinghuense TaxID=1560006 RepID=A0A4Q1SFS2_9BACT|nr:class I SAM-dependent methyltransferase [Silvibacterium dinghuense]RXS96418.1 hypothetical protein ESZ00_00165 [Silvibacterium dinghuense]GGG90614.1 hypothetical protein GCM10011586_01370 [Silvibacterium dinghuense]